MIFCGSYAHVVLFASKKILNFKQSRNFKQLLTDSFLWNDIYSAEKKDCKLLKNQFASTNFIELPLSETIGKGQNYVRKKCRISIILGQIGRFGWFFHVNLWQSSKSCLLSEKADSESGKVQDRRKSIPCRTDGRFRPYFGLPEFSIIIAPPSIYCCGYVS